MAEDQLENQLYHFSKKILFLSLFALIINIAWLFLVFRNDEQVHFREVAPKISFAKDYEIEMKTPFDDSFFKAVPNQSIFTGTQIVTGEGDYAEIKLEGNIVRIGEGTDIVLIENNFRDSDSARFVFKLNSGSVWVNAFDPIVIETPQSKALFAHSLGVVMYSKPLNRIVSVVGNVDLTLFDNNGKNLVDIVIPIKNQIAFVDTQLIPDYSKLEYLKLKKELKMRLVSSTILDEDWIKRNTKNNILHSLTTNNFVYSFAKYHFLSRYYPLKEKLTLIPGQKRLNKLNLAALKLNYLLGGVNADNNIDEAKDILKEFDELYDSLKDSSLFNEFIEKQFYVMRSMNTDSPAYLTKENLRQHLFIRDKDPEILRTYLADLDYLLRTNQLEQAEKLAGNWYNQWKPGLQKSHSKEFNRQARIYYSIVVAHIDSIRIALLDILDDVGDNRLKNSSDADEVLFEIALERLDVSKYLVANYRYLFAKTYLKTSYNKLNLSAKGGASAAASELFVKEGILIADRIDFAEQSLKGAAEPVDEKAFVNYLATQERDKSLVERFELFLEESKVPEIVIVPPTTSEVVDKLSNYKIIILDEDVIPDSNFPFQFEITSGRMLDRAEDGTSITFSAKYDYITDSVTDVVINNKPYIGNFTIDDLIAVATTSDADIKIKHAPEIDTENFANLLDIDDEDEAIRSQVIAQDLAVQLLIKELEQYDILVANFHQVTVLNPATLTDFKITDIYIEDSIQKRQVQVSFEYNSLTKIISSIALKESVPVTFPHQLKAEDFISTVFSKIYGKEQELAEVNAVIGELNKLGLILKGGDFTFTNVSRSKFDFKSMDLKTMPIKFSGTYDRNTKSFISVKHSLLTSRNISVRNYLPKIAELWVIDYLSDKGIVITKDNISSKLPSKKVTIKGYTRGDKVLNFVFDISTNRLLNVVLEGISTKVDSMTFEEFSLIKGRNAPSVPKPVVEEDEEDDLLSKLIGSCDSFADNLKTCARYSCEFEHPFTGKNMSRRIIGSVNDKCRYTEEMPEGQYMFCDFTDEVRTAVADYYSDLLGAGIVLTSVTLGDGALANAYTIDNQEIANPAQYAFDIGECDVIDR